MEDVKPELAVVEGVAVVKPGREIPLEMLARIFDQVYAERIGRYYNLAVYDTARQVILGGVNREWRNFSLKKGVYRCVQTLMGAPLCADQQSMQELARLFGMDRRRAEEAQTLHLELSHQVSTSIVDASAFLFRFRDL